MEIDSDEIGPVSLRKLQVKKLYEIKIGRYLTKNEVVHHIDGNPENNKISNLFLTTRGGNTKAHNSLTKLIRDLLDKKIIKLNKQIGKYENY